MDILLFGHVLGVVLFLGNIVTAAFWKIRAEASGDMATVSTVVRNVMIADYIFTVPGVTLILVTGHMMAAKNGQSVFELSWLGIAYGLFIITGLLWACVLLPLQILMIKQSSISLKEGQFTQQYKSASKVWNIVGTLTIVIPVVVLNYY
jgi:uncharacterized membrane protein